MADQSPGENSGQPPAYIPQNNQAGYPQGGYPQGGYPGGGNNQPPGIQPYGQAQFHAQPAQTTVVVQQGVVRPSSYLVLSCLVYWFCNCLFGAIGFGLSMASSHAADDNDMDGARKYGRAAMWVSIAGIICTVSISVLLIILTFTTPLLTLALFS